MKLDLTPEERKACRTGRKVQILILLEKNQRLTSTELNELCGFKKSSPNLASYTKRLRGNGLIDIYNNAPVGYAYFKVIDDYSMRVSFSSSGSCPSSFPDGNPRVYYR